MTIRAAIAGAGAFGTKHAEGLRETYTLHCATIGQTVRVELPGGAAVTGTATEIDRDGRLVVDGTPYAAGDVVHVRPANR